MRFLSWEWVEGRKGYDKYRIHKETASKLRRSRLWHVRDEWTHVKGGVWTKAQGESTRPLTGLSTATPCQKCLGWRWPAGWELHWEGLKDLLHSETATELSEGSGLGATQSALFSIKDWPSQSIQCEDRLEEGRPATAVWWWDDEASTKM